MLRSALLLSTFLLVAAVSERAQAQALDAACVYAANKAATVLIEYTYVTKDGVGTEMGSGFIISPSGHVITNAHVVGPSIKDVEVQSEAVSLRVGGILNSPVKATVVFRDPSLDLALLKILDVPNAGTWPTVTVGIPTNLPVGAPLIGLGFSSSDIAIVPQGQKTAENTVVDGELKPWWQTSLALNSGNSGGPVFGQLGTVVGVAVAKRINSQLVTYIIPIALAQHLLTAAEVRAAQAGRCAVFPECRDESHGIQGYAIEENVSRWGDWRRGGYNRGAFCNDFRNALQGQYPNSTFTFVGDSEESRHDSFRRFEYRYYCELKRRETPIYESKRSIACLK